MGILCSTFTAGLNVVGIWYSIFVHYRLKCRRNNKFNIQSHLTVFLRTSWPDLSTETDSTLQEHIYYTRVLRTCVKDHHLGQYCTTCKIQSVINFMAKVVERNEQKCCKRDTETRQRQTHVFVLNRLPKTGISGKSSLENRFWCLNKHSQGRHRLKQCVRESVRCRPKRLNVGSVHMPLSLAMNEKHAHQILSENNRPNANRVWTRQAYTQTIATFKWQNEMSLFPLEKSASGSERKLLSDTMVMDKTRLCANVREREKRILRQLSFTMAK